MGLYPLNPAYEKTMQNEYGGVVGLGHIAKLHYANPLAANAAAILAAHATSAAVPTVILAAGLLAQPDVARQISITPGGTTADVAAGVITILGKSMGGQVMSEDVPIAANAAAAVVTLNAFKSITSITFPIQDGAAATYAVGFTNKLGVPFDLTLNTVFAAYLNGVREAVLPTTTLGFVTLSSALNGSNVDVFLVI